MGCHTRTGTPQFWAIEGFRSGLDESAGLFDVLPNICVLALFTAFFVAIAIARFDRAEPKRSYGVN